MAQRVGTMRHGKFVFQNYLRPYYSKNKWDEQNIAAGTIFLYEQDNCPTGYSNVPFSDNRFLVADPTHDMDAGGSLNHTHTTANHNHTLTGLTAINGAYYGYWPSAAVNAALWHRHSVSYGGSTSENPNTELGNKNNLQIQTHRRYVMCIKD